MKLQLDPIKDKILEVEKPDGKLIKLKLRKITVGEVEKQEENQKEYMRRNVEDKISSVEYMFLMWETNIENLNREDFKDVPLEHMQLIGDAIGKLQAQGKDTEEKKSQ